LVLNPKQNKKIKAQQKLTLKEKQTTDRNSMKRKALEGSNDEEDIYKTEDIPRSKKLQKITKKKLVKKEKRNGKLKSLKVKNTTLFLIACFV
jgi:phage terminase small subunit